MDEGESSNKLNEGLDFELDEKYKTEYVAYDTVTSKLVTAYDCMFGDAKGHEVLPLKDAIHKIRQDMDTSIKMGDVETEGVLIDIRQALNQ